MDDLEDLIAAFADVMDAESASFLLEDYEREEQEYGTDFSDTDDMLEYDLDIEDVDDIEGENGYEEK